jgi:molecular chaperone DnaK
MLVADARQAVKEEAPLDRIRSLSSDLQQVYHALASVQPSGGSQPGPGGATGGGAAGGGGQPPSSGPDDVIDADFDRS